MPRVVRLYIRECLLGMALGVVFAMVLVVFNVANLQHLIDNVDGGWLAFALLAFFNGIVFAGAQFGMTVMRMGTDTDDDDVTGPPQP